MSDSPPSSTPPSSPPSATSPAMPSDPPAGLPPESPPANAADASGASPAPKKSKPKMTWSRRFRRIALVLIALAVLVRLVVAIAFPVVLARVAAFYGLQCSYDRMELSMLSGDAGLWNLSFTPKGSTEPIFNSEYVRGDISTLNLLRGRLDVWRVEADGVNILIDRDADGSIPILKLLGPHFTPSTTAPAAAPAATSSGPGKPINLSPPLRIDALRLTHIRARIHDQSVAPPLDATFTLNLRLSNLGWANAPVHFAVDLDADPILDAMHVEGDGRADDKSLDATLAAKVDGLRLRPLEPYLRALGILPTANEISLKAGGELKLSQATGNASILAGALDLDDLSAIADGQEAAGLDHFALNADAINLRTIKLSTISIDNARVSAGRSANGRVRFAGVEFIGVPPSTQPSPAPSSPSISLPVISLGSFDLQHLHAGFHDDAIAPPVSLGIDVRNLKVKNIVLDPSQPDAMLQLSGEVLAPGLFEKASFQGTAKPFAMHKTINLSLQTNGIAPTALEPYFNAFGIESRLHNATFGCDLSADVSLPKGGLAADLKVKGIKLSDSGDLLAMNQVSVSGASYQISPPLIRLKDIELAGPVLSIDHEAGGALTAVGFATKPRTGGTASSFAAPGVPPSTEPSSAQPTPILVLPAVEIDHFAWKGIDIHYADQSLDPPAATELSDAGVELNNFLLDLSSADANAPATQPAPAGTIRAWAKIPNLIDNVDLEGTVTPTPAALACDLKLTGSGFTAAVVAPYLKSIGIETTLQNGSFGAEVNAHASRKGVSLDAEKIHLSDGDQELAGVDSMKIGDSTLKMSGREPANDQLNIGAIEVDRPRISVTHEADGAFTLMGVRLLPSLFNRPAAAAATPMLAPAPPTTAPATSALPIDIALSSLNVKDATLKWADNAVKPDVQTSAIANLAISQLTIGKSAGPAQLHADARIEGSIDSAAVDGTITPSLKSPAIKLNVTAAGIRAGALASYLPPGLTVPLQNGQFHTGIEAGANQNPQGGLGARFIVSDLDYRDQGQAQPLLKVDSFRAIASRIDPAQKFFAIDEISSSGVETAAKRTPDGAISLLGIALNPVQASPAAVSAGAATQATAVPPEAPAAGASAPSNVAALVAQARARAPLITLDRLDLNLKRFALTDEMRPQAAPLVISDLRFRNMAAVNWGGRDAESHPPTPFRMDCTVDPVIGALTVTTQIAPFAVMPSAAGDLTAADISGDGVAALVPELKPYIDGSALESGVFHAHADTQFRVNRKGAWEIDLSRGFSADLDVKDIAYRATPGGPIIAGLDDIHSDAIKITPASGDVHVKTLEITNLIGEVVRQSDGIHVLGLVVKLPAAGAKAQATPATTATTAPATQQAGARPATAPAAQSIVTAKRAAPTPPAAAGSTPPPVKPKGEIRVDQLLISGIKFVAEDQTMTPPLIFPLNSLDVEVRDFTTLAPYEDKPIRFNALVNAGKVPLPRKVDAGSTGGALAAKPEERELFAQASANGQISLYPQPHGWIKTSVSGLELAALKGVAHEAGVTLTGGVYDSTADARLPGDGMIHTSSRFVFTDLSLSEPPQGPIYRLLHLPAPLDVVVGALQDQEGSITVPIDVPVPVQVNKLSVTDVVGPAIGAFGSIVATAIASAPLKAVGGVGDLLGLGGNKKQAPEPPVVLPFEPGYTALSPADQAAIKALALRMKDDKSLNLVINHDLGGGDLTVANERANPSIQDAQNLAEQMRQQQMNALQQRSALAGQARAELAWGSSQSAEATIERLRALDQQVAQNDDAMDRLFGILRPGADRQAARRTRGACLEYGRERLDAVKQALTTAGLTDMDRVHLANPQFAQVPGDEGGKVIVTLVPKKKE